MNELNDLKVKMNAVGGVDVEYYVSQAHQMRAEALSDLGKELKAWVLGHLNLQWLKVSFARLAHH